MSMSLSHVVILGLLGLGSTDGSVTTSVSIRGARTAQSAQPADSEDGREQSLPLEHVWEALRSQSF